MIRRTFLGTALGGVALGLGARPAAALSVTDSRGPQEFDVPPQRVVALSWSLVEQLLTLGVTPAGAADPAGYRRWVKRPALPEGVADLGLRQEPNIEALAALEPDAVLISDDQLGFIQRLTGIAPVLHFDAYSADHDNAAKADAILRKLGRLLGRADRADASLAERDARIAAARRRVADRFGDDPPRVAVVRFVDAQRVAIHGANAMPVYALDALGLPNATPRPPTPWGVTIQPIRELGKVEADVLLYLEPFPQAEEVFGRPLWQAMPFVRDGRVASLPPTWTYGGAMSLAYLAEAIADALLPAEAR